MNANRARTTKAIILAAGRGTRMRELTAEMPKPMVEVRGKPILQHILQGLAAAEFQQVLIVVGYRKEVILNHFGDGGQLGLRLEYVEQTVQDGTGRVVGLAKDFCGDEPFLMSYGDILVDPRLYQRLRDLDEAEMLIAVKYSSDLSKGGAVYVDQDFYVTDLREKQNTGQPGWYNAGICAFRPSIFPFIAKLEKSPRGEYELTDAIRAMALSGMKVKAVEIEGSWADVRDPEVLRELNR